jgi:hypothetical protein
VRRSAGWLLLVIGVPAMMNLLLAHSSVTIGLISPIWTMILAGDSKYAAAPMDFWISLVLIQAIGLVFLFRACVVLRRGLVEESEPVPSIPPILRRHIWHGIGVSAAYWVASRQRGFKAIVWIAVLLWVIFNLGYSVLIGRWYSTFGQVGLWLPQFLLTLGSSALLAWGASRALFESRQTGELELLLTTPIGVRELLKGHWLFHKRALRFPLGLLALTMALPWVFGLLNHPSAFNYLLRYVAAYPLSMLSAILGFAALCQVGLWFGLTAPTQARAIFSTVLAVKGVPFTISLLGTLLPLFGFTGRILPIYLLPNLIAIAYYIWIIQKTWQRISRF